MSDALCNQSVLSGTQPLADVDDIIVDILSRLPAKSLLRFRCVCKAWRAWLSHPYFIQKYLTRICNRASTNYSLLVDQYDQQGLFGFRSLEYQNIFKSWSHDDPVPIRSLNYPVIDWKWQYIVGYCNGLICLQNSYCNRDFMLWNPCTGEFRVLPQAPVPSVDDDWIYRTRNLKFYGFGYDSTSDDYKVILGCFDKCVEYVVVFTLKTSIWRAVKSLGMIRKLPMCPVGCLVDQTLHWVSKDRDLVDRRIVSFVLKEEKFQEISLPRRLLDPDPNPRSGAGVMACCYLQVYNDCNCLALICSFREEESSMWVLKEYGVEESWTQVIDIARVRAYLIRASENGQLLVLKRNDDYRTDSEPNDCAISLALYNPRDNAYRIIMKDTSLRSTATYIETLVSPLSGSISANL